MNLISKILLESEDENLFKPRRLDSREEQLKRDFLEFKNKLKDIWIVKTRSKKFPKIVTRYLVRGLSEEEVKQKTQEHLIAIHDKMKAFNYRKIVSMKPIVLNNKNTKLMFQRFENFYTTREFINGNIDILIFT